jgi:pimeloyl-ACP methyl ester carboxylesterase
MEYLTLKRRNGVLHYWLGGPEGATLVVFTHGVMMDHRIFQPQRVEFMKHHRVLLWDVRGHGRSRPDGGEFSIRLAAEDLLAILDRIGAEKIVLVGHSMGGYISQEAIFLSPERFAGLVTVGSTCLTSKPAKLIRLGQVVLPTFFRCTPDKLFRWITPVASGLKPKTRGIATVVSRIIRRYDRQRYWTAIMRGYHHEPGYRMNKPFLMTHGDRDNLAFGTIRLLAPDWARREPQCQYVVIPNAGHNAHQDNPAFFNSQLCEFLNAINAKR